MKVKRPITLLFFLFASMLLLVHSVLPHFHHDSIVCFSFDNASSACNTIPESSQTDCVTDGCKKDHHNGHRHEHKGAEDCNLKEIVIRQDNSNESDLVQSVSLLSLFYTIYPLNTFFLEAPEFGLIFREKPYSDNYISPSTGFSLSLRAPPVLSI